MVITQPLAYSLKLCIPAQQVSTNLKNFAQWLNFFLNCIFKSSIFGAQSQGNFTRLFYLIFRYIRSRAYLTQQHILGDTHIYEEVLGYRFRISPESFFQLNTAGAQVLYTVVQDLVKACRPKTLLDVGCGTGVWGFFFFFSILFLFCIMKKE